MSETINIYCDESCHLENEKCKIMTVSCLRCPKTHVRQISEDIRAIKQKHKIWKFAELKWSKVSQSKEDFYFDLLNYFLNNHYLHFRAIIINKEILDHKSYQQTHTEWYYKMVYDLVKYILDNNSNDYDYNVYTDKKENSFEARQALLKAKECLSNHYRKKIHVQNIESHKSEILQLNDFIQGIISYHNRKMHLINGANPTKKKLTKHLIDILRIDLNKKNRNNKFNIFIWGEY